MKRSLVLVIALGLVGCATSPAHPGTALPLPHPMTANEHVDLLYVSPGLRLQDYDLLVVAQPRLEAPIVDRELAYVPWAQDLRTALAQAMKRSGLFATVVEAEPTDTAGTAVLVLESAVVELDPGDQAVRWMFGEFGAGHSFIQVEGRIVDARTQEVLAQFADRRRGAAVFHLTGGDSQALLQEDLRGIAKSLAKALTEAQGHGATSEGRR